MIGLGGPSTLFGMKVCINPFPQMEPVLQLSPDFPWCTPKFRADMNAKLLALFGKREVAYLLTNEQAMFVSGRMMREIDRMIERTIMGDYTSNRIG